MRVNDDVGLSAAILRSLDDLLRALRLDQVADDRFRVGSGSTGLVDQIYGGQLLAQGHGVATRTSTSTPITALDEPATVGIHERVPIAPSRSRW
jgi:hypothetical protein